MRSTYRVLAFLIATCVALQASFVALSTFGIFTWVDEGSDLTSAVLDGDWEWDGAIGAVLHSIFGTGLIPLLALILLIVSFFAKVPGGAKWAGLVLLTVVVQVVLGIVAFSIPYVGALHGLNAFLLFGLALMAAMRANGTTVQPTPHGTQQNTHV